MNNYEVLWMCKPDGDVVNLHHFIKNNPSIKYHICKNQENDIRTVWRNCDRSLRNWWLENRNLFSSEYLLVLEWDVLVTKKINIIFKPGFSCVSTRDSSHKWDWLKESNMLVGMEPFGFVPFAVLAFDRKALDYLCDSRWDRLYEDDVFCELRVGSIAKRSGMQINILPGMGEVKYIKNNIIKGPGIYHSVKHRIT